VALILATEVLARYPVESEHIKGNKKNTTCKDKSSRRRNNDHFMALINSSR
jgi:hypothetical protein